MAPTLPTVAQQHPLGKRARHPQSVTITRSELSGPLNDIQLSIRTRFDRAKQA
jgi:hypothetical protein